MVNEEARVPLPTPFGPFVARAFECASGNVYLAMTKGRLDIGPILTRVHSECLTGDVFGSLRCDCGVQLREALRGIAAEGRGVLIYATGHEGRGIGLVNKLRSYMDQDQGSDTVDANLHLGLPVDGRSYEDAAGVLAALGVGSIKLMTNNPEKVAALGRHGIIVDEVQPLTVAPHTRNSAYLSTKRNRLGHNGSLVSPPTVDTTPVDVRKLLGPVRPRHDRPYVVVKYAQSLDGRIATSTGDSQWISSEAERMVSHSMRAHCDAVMAGIGTVINDDPQLTVRLVPGSSPIRVVLDSTLRLSAEAKVVSEEGATIVITTDRSEIQRRRELMTKGAEIAVLAQRDGLVDLGEALGYLRRRGIESLLVEGGAKVITSFLGSRGLADRLVVSIAPRVMGLGTEAVGDLGISEVSSSLVLSDPIVHLVGRDVVLGADLRDRSEGGAGGTLLLEEQNERLPDTTSG
ncbi:MAG: GTP cyclohydrolase II RibA [Actinobacteria bacterium]|nr:GTP cyclohydrolase II RibA [Actinomycetota bacterium]